MPDSPHTADIVELKACPFCGHSDELQVTHTGAADEWWWEVFCDHCCTHGPTSATEADAIAAWNARTPDPEAAAEIKALREALEEIRDLNGLGYESDRAWAFGMQFRAHHALKNHGKVRT